MVLKRLQPKARSALFGVLFAVVVFIITLAASYYFPPEEKTSEPVEVPSYVVALNSDATLMDSGSMLEVPPEETIVKEDKNIEKDLPPADAEEASPPAVRPSEPEQDVPASENTEEAETENSEPETATDTETTEEVVAAEPDAEPKEQETSTEYNNGSWKKNSRKFDQNKIEPRISIIITQMGLSRDATQAAIALPADITLAFAPYADSVNIWIQKTRAAGHEVLMSMPMEPDDYPREDPGPNALLGSLPDQENISRLNWILSRANGFVGVSSYMGEAFTRNEKKLTPVINHLKKRDLMIVETHPTGQSLLSSLARINKVPYVGADRIIDELAARSAIDENLKALEEIAKKKGHAIGVAHAYPVTFERLRSWLPTLAEKDLTIAPISALTILE